MKPSLLFAIAALCGALAVLLGAFGAHGLKAVLTESQLHTYQTATEYLMYHALALVGVSAVWFQFPGQRGFAWAGGLMILGILLFSGSLYGLVFLTASWLVWLTPLGGISLLLSWLLLFWQGLRGLKAASQDSI